MEDVGYRTCTRCNRYRIGDNGSVWSNYYGEWRQIKALPMGSSGYLSVHLWYDNKRHPVAIHTLVLEAFVGPCPEGMQCCHGPLGKFDNRLSNLRWDTVQANHDDRKADGTVPRGERHHRAKITESDVREIRRLVSTGLPGYLAAQRFGINQSTARRIVRRELWTHVT
jgi:hypothetical protein